MMKIKKIINSDYKKIDGKLKRISRKEKWYLFGFHFWTVTKNYNA